MFIVWRGWGWLVLVFFLLTWLLESAVLTPLYKAITGFEYVYNAEHGILWAVGLVIAGVAIFLFNRFVLRPLERVPTTPEAFQARAAAKAAAEQAAASGAVPAPAEAPAVAPRKTFSSFFFIPMRVWPIIALAIAVLLLVVNIPVAIDEVSLREGS